LELKRDYYSMSDRHATFLGSESTRSDLEPRLVPSTPSQVKSVGALSSFFWKRPSLHAAPPRAGGREGAASALLGYDYYSSATPNEPFHVSPAWRMLMLQRHQVMPTEQGTAH
jgi:hypothetical protein